MPTAKKVATKEKTAKKNDKLSKKVGGRYREGSTIAQLYDILSTGKDFDVKELAQRAGKGKSIATPLARLERHGKSGIKMEKWTLIRKGHTVRLVKAKKAAASTTTAAEPQPAGVANSTDKPA